jgi:hypothetical protein
LRMPPVVVIGTSPQGLLRRFVIGCQNSTPTNAGRRVGKLCSGPKATIERVDLARPIRAAARQRRGWSSQPNGHLALGGGVSLDRDRSFNRDLIFECARFASSVHQAQIVARSSNRSWEEFVTSTKGLLCQCPRESPSHGGILPSRWGTPIADDVELLCRPSDLAH